MPLPENANFEEFLSSFSRVNLYDADYESLLIIPEINARLSNGILDKKKAKFIWYNKNAILSIKSLIERIRQELKNTNHPSSDQIIKSLLFLFTFHPKQKTNSIAAFNEILEMQTFTEVSQFYILTDLKVDKFNPIIFKSFSFDILDEKRFSHKCEKAGSDYFQRYGHELVNKLCIEKKRFDSKVINWLLFSEKFVAALTTEYNDGVLYYFETLSSVLFDEFWFEFNEQQNLHIAHGLGILNERILREKLLSNYVAIYLKISTNGKNRGYVVPLQFGILEIIVHEKLGNDIKDFYQFVDQKFSFSSFSNFEIHQTLKTFVNFVSKGYRYLEENKKDEGFLHFVIALDLLFGDINESTKTVSNRCALLTFSKMNNTYQQQKKLMNEIYDSRSKYVHEGRSVNEKYIEDAKPITKEIMLCLLRLQKSDENRNLLTIEKWKKKIDYACSALEAEKPLTDDVKTEIGMELN
jgi:hypothetical protein